MLFATIVLAEVKQAYKTCQAIDIQIHSNGAQQFIDTKLLYQQLTTSHQPPVLGQPLRTLTTKPIENTIKSDNFVHKSIVYKSWQGVLNIAIWPRKPIARILYTHQPSQYIDEEGQLLPLSDRYTARVPLIEADHLPGVQNDLHESPYGRALLALLRHIAQDKFWRAQIAHLCIDAQGKIVFHTQISKQRVEFGPPQDVASKLAKLQLFYQKIVPHKGWNAYKRVNLEFANQIVCE
ncbi:MAG: cell division protein FtsQ [Bacteroidota bacterium]